MLGSWRSVTTNSITAKGDTARTRSSSSRKAGASVGRAGLTCGRTDAKMPTCGSVTEQRHHSSHRTKGQQIGAVCFDITDRDGVARLCVQCGDDVVRSWVALVLRQAVEANTSRVPDLGRWAVGVDEQSHSVLAQLQHDHRGTHCVDELLDLRVICVVQQRCTYEHACCAERLEMCETPMR